MKKTLCFAAFSAGTMLAGTGMAAAHEAPPPAPAPEEPAPVEAAAPVEAPAPAEQPPSRAHTVAAGESLSRISQAELGTSDRWVEIFALNQGSLPNPDLIQVGQVLAIPTAPVPVPADLLASLAPAPAPTPRLSATSTRQSATSTRQSATSTRQSATTRTRAARSGGGGGSLAAIRACESSGNYGAVSPSGKYRGAYQFDQRTWESVGGSGDPAAASPGEQDARASRLRAQRGSNPWPNCG
ncbi:MAG TPA: transglycosylase family protein [Acidimicrobiales bacterium]|nr:transglycosylase family protein [Acidimicrobiales bacterium]